MQVSFSNFDSPKKIFVEFISFSLLLRCCLWRWTYGAENLKAELPAFGDPHRVWFTSTSNLISLDLLPKHYQCYMFYSEARGHFLCFDPFGFDVFVRFVWSYCQSMRHNWHISLRTTRPAAIERRPMLVKALLSFFNTTNLVFATSSLIWPQVCCRAPVCSHFKEWQ